MRTAPAHDTHLAHLRMLSPFEKLHDKMQVEKTEDAEEKSKDSTDAKDDAKDGKKTNEADSEYR